MCYLCEKSTVTDSSYFKRESLPSRLQVPWVGALRRATLGLMEDQCHWDCKYANSPSPCTPSCTPPRPSPAQVNRGSCNNYYGSLSGSCDFKVDTFVLPRFEVKVTAPEYIHKSTENIEGSVSAEWVQQCLELPPLFALFSPPMSSTLLVCLLLSMHCSTSPSLQCCYPYSTSPPLHLSLPFSSPPLPALHFASYVFGEPVEGNVTIKFTLEASGRRESFDFHTISATLVSV